MFDFANGMLSGIIKEAFEDAHQTNREIKEEVKKFSFAIVEIAKKHHIQPVACLVVAENILSQVIDDLPEGKRVRAERNTLEEENASKTKEELARTAVITILEKLGKSE